MRMGKKSFRPGKVVASIVLACGLAFSTSSGAAPLIPTSYDMLNGHGRDSGGSYNYWDGSYDGAGSVTTDGASLSGGLGDLTDGVIPTLNWNNVENVAGTGPYVGWRNLNPVITFHFGETVAIDSVTIHVDDSDYGGVRAPGSVEINGDSFAVTDPPGSAPFSATFGDLDAVGSSLTLQLFRTGSWLFLSEVTFQGSKLPEVAEPATLALFGVGLAGLGYLRRRRKS